MAPSKSSLRNEPPVEGVPSREDFLETLTAFGKERGVQIDFESKVSGRDIDLYDLYKVVTHRGGYDAVSAERLAWRKVVHDFDLGSAWAAAYAFALKTIYYKNLVAYEIKFWHKQEPPPIEILENLTAKGGNVLTRTLENFVVPKTSEITNGASESDGDEHGTPKADQMDVDEGAGVSGRSTRGLRQQPPQRILFQPDLSSTRQVRHSMGPASSPQPQPNGLRTGPNSSNGEFSSSAFNIAAYEPRPLIPLTLRPVLTPGNNLPLFQAQAKQLRDAKLSNLGLTTPNTIMKPGAGFEGPNIYVRILNSLRSPIRAEQDYALHHMVKISHERGDKYRFESFPGLAEGLLEYLLQMSAYFYDIEWRVSYDPDDDDFDVLDGINGSADILERIDQLERIDPLDDLLSVEAAHRFNKYLEAALTLRNLALLEDNAINLSKMPHFRDVVIILLNLPHHSAIPELQGYILEVLEHVVKYWMLSETDPLYLSLLRCLAESDDRSVIMATIRVVCRISLNLEVFHTLPAIPMSIIQRLFDWSLLGDEQFVGTCLDFLYQFTATPRNVLLLLQNRQQLQLMPVLHHMTRLIQHRAARTTAKITVFKGVSAEPATEVPAVSIDLLETFLRHEEPERSRLWLRAVFEEESDSYITQISLWQAYQQRFAEFAAHRPLLPAADFIKTVSTVFVGANAQVITAPVQKFIIKGIRPRHAPVDPKGRSYLKCQWQASGQTQCGQFFLNSRAMLDHLLQTHLYMYKDPDGRWQMQSAAAPIGSCFWNDCQHYQKQFFIPTTLQLGRHVATHLPDDTPKCNFRHKHNRTPASQSVPVKLIHDSVEPAFHVRVDPCHGREATTKELVSYNSAGDDVGNAAGLPLTSALVLRNLARNIPKAVSLMDEREIGGITRDEARPNIMNEILGPVRQRLMFVVAHNRTLAGYVADVLGWIERGSLAK